MKRKAIIIAPPLSPSHEAFLPGVEMDVINYNSFLTSPVGGGWHSNEIQVLWNPTRSEVAKVIQASQSDYLFSVFSGHGGIDSKTQKSYVNLNDKENAYLEQLKGQSTRQLAIIDACRTYGYSGISGIGDPQAFISFKSALSEHQSRQLFEHRIALSPQGWTILHSSSPGQSAKDAPEGGLFSQSLLRSASEWGAKFELGSILPVSIAYEYSHWYLKKVFRAAQNPRIWHSKSHPFFPFGFRFGSELKQYKIIA